ncbi:hypothetical protein QTP88_026464 [Uroleucon formosanum]
MCVALSRAKDCVLKDGRPSHISKMSRSPHSTPIVPPTLLRIYERKQLKTNFKAFCLKVAISLWKIECSQHTHCTQKHTNTKLQTDTHTHTHTRDFDTDTKVMRFAARSISPTYSHKCFYTVQSLRSTMFFNVCSVVDPVFQSLLPVAG